MKAQPAVGGNRTLASIRPAHAAAGGAALVFVLALGLALGRGQTVGTAAEPGAAATAPAPAQGRSRAAVADRWYEPAPFTDGRAFLAVSDLRPYEGAPAAAPNALRDRWYSDPAATITPTSVPLRDRWYKD